MKAGSAVPSALCVKCLKLSGTQVCEPGAPPITPALGKVCVRPPGGFRPKVSACVLYMSELWQVHGL